jgi:plasmid stabilization system protein ParE
MRVHWTDRAKARLRLIHDYIAEDSPKTALQVIDRITARSQQLKQLSRSGRQVPEYEHQDVRELLEKPYRIIYIIKPHQIDVLTVMHYRQILPRDIEQL